MDITEEMLSGGAKLIAVEHGSTVFDDDHVVYEFTEAERDQYRAEAKAVIEFAAPLIAAQALRDAADLVDRGPTFRMPPSVISALLRERADDLAPAP